LCSLWLSAESAKGKEMNLIMKKIRAITSLKAENRELKKKIKELEQTIENLERTAVSPLPLNLGAASADSGGKDEDHERRTQTNY
jgi:cell division septum initiation protein DivIVA